MFGEKSPGRWMAGSDFYSRTPADQQASAVETADSRTLVQMAIVYRGNRISLFRNGAPYASYDAKNIELLSAKDNIVVFGRRHVGATTGQVLPAQSTTPESTTRR